VFIDAINKSHIVPEAADISEWPRLSDDAQFTTRLCIKTRNVLR